MLAAQHDDDDEVSAKDPTLFFENSKLNVYLNGWLVGWLGFMAYQPL